MQSPLTLEATSLIGFQFEKYGISHLPAQAVWALWDEGDTSLGFEFEVTTFSQPVAKLQPQLGSHRAIGSTMIFEVMLFRGRGDQRVVPL